VIGRKKPCPVCATRLGKKTLKSTPTAISEITKITLETKAIHNSGQHSSVPERLGFRVRDPMLCSPFDLIW